MRNFLCQIFDEGGQEIIELRTEIEAENKDEAEIKASEYEEKCISEGYTDIDWYEISYI